MSLKKIKVLIVDDSAVVRNILSRELGKCPNIVVVGTAPDPYIARDKIVADTPDVITLDVEMPRMDGITFLEKLMRSKPLPVIILSTLTPTGCETAIRAMDLGAIEVLHKPELDLSYKLNEMISQLVEKIEAASKVKFSTVNHLRSKKNTLTTYTNKSAMIKTTDKVVAIGASTGGTEAIKHILPMLPANFPGIVLAQHMPENFTKSFAKNLNNISAIEVKEAEDGDTVRPGLCLLARGNYHMLLRRSGARYFVNVKTGPMIHYQRPAVDILFESVAKYAGINSIGVILTGMGKDGGAGLLKMKESGAVTIGQDEKSCVVYGMPKFAESLGAIERVKPLDAIAGELMKLISK